MIKEETTKPRKITKITKPFSYTIRFVRLRVLCVFVVSLLAIVIVAAQENPAFEVASIKQNTSGDGGQLIRIMPGNRFNVTNMAPRQLIIMSYQLQQFQVTGGPSWITSDHYDIVAKMAGEQAPFVPGQPNPMMLAMRTLLADRFKLKLHKETREMDVYNLVMIKPGVPGPALKASTTDCVKEANARRGGPPPAGPPAPPGPNDPFPCGLMGMPGMIRMGGMPIAQITQMLTNQTGRLVYDKTNLTGNWDFMLKYLFEQRGNQPLPPGVPAPDPDAPSIYTALQEQLGMKLESAKAPVEMTVIDSIEHPTDD
jgi:uncharacterized protein (TIGR03435 family)